MDAEENKNTTVAEEAQGAEGQNIEVKENSLEGGAYEVLRKRLTSLDENLCATLDNINAERKKVFGGQESCLIGSERIMTENNCVPRDIIGVGESLIFGYNVFLGLRAETKVSDVFSIHTFNGSEFRNADLSLLSDSGFVNDFQELYKYYKNVRFLQFIKKPGKLMLIFQCGETVEDVKIFRFKINKENTLSYIDSRGDMDYQLPPQHDFEWTITTRDDQVAGLYPHINIKDQLFVECIGGDLTIKVENNTESGEGIYSEPVENPDQTLDDAAIFYAIVEDLILLKIKPFRETYFRYFVYNKKYQSVTRIDSIERACIRLPEGHGLIFPRGYYLQNGVNRQFEEDIEGVEFLECVKSPNGEDFLYVFYHEEQGLHILIQYNLISKEIANPIFCHGYSLYDDGKMVIFNSPDDEPKRNHPMQIWQTPFCSDTFEAPQKTDSYMNKIGNRDLVRGISEGYAISRLIATEKITIYTYQDIINAATNMLDGYHWLDHESVFNIRTVVQEIRTAAIAAVDEYEKVVSIRENTEKRLKKNQREVKRCLLDYTPDSMTNIESFVKALDDIRTRRGQVISLRELRYADGKLIEEMDSQLAKAGENVALACVDFLLKDDALQPYIQSNNEIDESLKTVSKIADVKPLRESLEQLAKNLDLLTDIVNNLEIDDATKTAKIVDSITDVYAGVNRTRATVKNLAKEIGKEEAKAEFAAQFKLVSQSVTNYIGMCDTPEKCEEFLTKVMINIEELEGKFADYDEYIEQLTEKREEAYSAFSGRKQTLEEEKKRRVTSLLSSAERILKGIIGRAESFKTVEDVNSYFASDLMVAKLRDIIQKLLAAGDTVKADDLNGRLKSSKDEIIRRLRDKIDLFEEGENVIKLGDYKFTVNTQPLELTTIFRDHEMFFHLTGTDFYEKIEDEEFLTTKSLWEQEIISESKNVYRGEFLAYKILTAAANNEKGLSTASLTESLEEEGKLLHITRDFASSLYNEGYEKGVHDHDATAILEHLIKLYNSCELLRYDSESRAYAILFWHFYSDEDFKSKLRNRMKSFGSLARTFKRNERKKEYVDEIKSAMDEFFKDMNMELDVSMLDYASEYLYYELQDQEELEFTINALAHELCKRFMACLKKKKIQKEFLDSVGEMKIVKDKINLIHDWASSYVKAEEDDETSHFIWELVALIAAGDAINQDATSVTTYVEIKDLTGQHPLIQDKTLPLHFDRFLLKLKQFNEVNVPTFNKYAQLRAKLTETRREEMRLAEFKPKVMGSFVRNKLINDVYLNLVGANFAKQMGVAGENKRTDLMGLLLLISPPGYGKTTLMEYMSSRLGLTFMKINGPAIGHRVMSLDPIEAPNATSREELNKLNLSLEMGNNVMIYLDDIQHLNPEFLQKFISLCDAQRKIEGVYKGKTRTYDLRGKKVVVVMAGNPYTESGDKFKIPDMLANRADTYNLGDITSTAADAFESSFIENAMTSNSALSVISSHGHEDIYRFMEVVKRGSQEGIEFNYSYSAAESGEITNVLKKLFRIREIVLKINSQYIYSAAQQDEYRIEPQFKLQGSYRNMNRMAEKVFPVMTDEEVDQLIIDHYYNEAQTLTTGAESNILKFKEMMNIMSDDERNRWEQIKSEFNRRQTLAGVDDSSEMGKIITQLSGFNANMGNIKLALDKGFDIGLKQLSTALAKAGENKTADLSPLIEALEKLAEKQKDLKISTEFPPDYISLFEHQARLIESLTPIFKSIEKHSENYSKLKNVIDKLLLGQISIQLNKQ